VKKASLILILLGTLLTAAPLLAQESGGQDSTGLDGTALRPRRDAYIIEPFPSPARHGQTVKVQIYLHFAQQVSLRIVDINDKTVKILQPLEMLSNGIHTYDFPTNPIATGSYHIRMVTYTSTGSENVTEDSRFIVLH
jgi:hypothetical protein